MRWPRRPSANKWIVIETLAQRPEGWYGLDLMRATKILAGTIYPILEQLERDGIVRSWWADDSDRRMYALVRQP